MSQSPNVLVGVGVGKHLRLLPPKQNYSNLFTQFNIPSILKSESDPMFFNKIARNDASDSIPNNIEIYGFMEGAWSYAQENSIQHIVDFFQQDSQISIVVCDVIIDKGDYKTQQYVHPLTIQNNIPFFIRQSIVNKINFINEPNAIHEQLKRLQQEHIIFHIAAPLLSLNTQGNE